MLGGAEIYSNISQVPVTKNGHPPSAKRDDVSSNSEVHLSKNCARSGVKKIIRVNTACRFDPEATRSSSDRRLGLAE